MKICTIRKSRNYRGEILPDMKEFVKGKSITAGNKIRCVMVQSSSENMRLVEDFINGSEVLDYDRYVSSLKNPIKHIFETKYGKVLDNLRHISYRKSPRYKYVYLNDPITMVLQMKQQGYDFNLLKQYRKFIDQVLA